MRGEGTDRANVFALHPLPLTLHASPACADNGIGLAEDVAMRKIVPAHDTKSMATLRGSAARARGRTLHLVLSDRMSLARIIHDGYCRFTNDASRIMRGRNQCPWLPQQI